LFWSSSLVLDVASALCVQTGRLVVYISTSTRTLPPGTITIGGEIVPWFFLVEVTIAAVIVLLASHLAASGLDRGIAAGN